MVFREVWIFSGNLSGKFKIHLNLTRITDTLLEEQSIFMITSRSVLLWVRNVSEKLRRENQNTYFGVIIFLFEHHAVYKVMWEKYCRVGHVTMRTRHMLITCWVLKATDTHSEYVIHIPFSTATTFTRTCLVVTLYEIYLSYFHVTLRASIIANCLSKFYCPSVGRSACTHTHTHTHTIIRTY
jgi:hypothetical protein